MILRCFKGDRLRLRAFDLSEFTSKLQVLNFFFLIALNPLNLLVGKTLLILIYNKIKFNNNKITILC